MAGLNWDVLLIQFAALALGALIKGATGQGLPVVSMPILAIFLGVPHAIAILIIPIVATNFWQLWQFRREGREARFLPAMLSAGVVGIIVGTVALKHFAAGWSSLCLGLILAGYIALCVGNPSFVTLPHIARRIAAPVGFAAGLIQGAAGLSSPIGTPFIHSMRLSRQRLIFSVSAMFMVFALAQLLSMIFVGIYRWGFFVEGLIALVPVFIFMPLGNMLGRRLSPKRFDMLFLASLAMSATALIYAGWTTVFHG